MPLGEANLPKRCLRMRPEIPLDQRPGGFDVIGADLGGRLRRWLILHRPFEQAERPGKAQNVRRGLGQPFPLPPVYGFLLAVRKLPELLKLLSRICR